jgi:hypothetical protein
VWKNGGECLDGKMQVVEIPGPVENQPELP